MVINININIYLDNNKPLKMYGWWSQDYLVKNHSVQIHIFSTDNESNVMVIEINNSGTIPPDNQYNWISVGKIKNYIRTINYNNLIEKGTDSNCQGTPFTQIKNDNQVEDNNGVENQYDNEMNEEHCDKKRKVSLGDITFTSGVNYGWYSQEFVNKKFNSVFDRNNNVVPHPKIHRYLTPNNSSVLVTHISSNPEDKPFFSDTYFVGEVTKYLESVYFD